MKLTVEAHEVDNFLDKLREHGDDGTLAITILIPASMAIPARARMNPDQGFELIVESPDLGRLS